MLHNIYMLNKKLIIIFTLGILNTIFFLSCFTFHNINFPPENENIDNSTFSMPGIHLSEHSNNNHVISVNFYFDTPFQIKEFEFNYGSIQIGKHEIILGIDEISLSIHANSRFNVVYSQIEGGRIRSNLTQPITVVNELDCSIIRYYFRIIKFNLRNRELRNIRREYNENNIKARLNLCFTILANNEIVKKQIIEEYNVEITSQRINIFQVMSFAILTLIFHR